MGRSASPELPSGLTLEVALILNFGPKREHWRRILTNDRKTPNLSV